MGVAQADPICDVRADAIRKAETVVSGAVLSHLATGVFDVDQNALVKHDKIVANGIYFAIEQFELGDIIKAPPGDFFKGKIISVLIEQTCEPCILDEAGPLLQMNIGSKFDFFGLTTKHVISNNIGDSASDISNLIYRLGVIESDYGNIDIVMNSECSILSSVTK